MTLCIAAELRHNDKNALVHCIDTRQEKGGVFHELVGSEDATKIRWLGANFHGLMSGISTKAFELMTDCQKAIRELTESPGKEDADLELNRFLQGLRTVAQERKKAIIDHYLQMNLGISREQFLDTSQKRFAPDHYNQLWSEIRNLDVGTDLIISGFHGNESVLIRLDRAGEVHWENGYSVVGIGSDIALAFLCQRDYSFQNIGLMDCLMRVMEAKKAAERNRHVGQKTMIVISIEGLGRFRLTNEGWNAVDASVEVRQPLEFKEGFIEKGV